MCGLVTGGRDECWWNCTIERVEDPSRPGSWFLFIPDPPCLANCYPADHCLSRLLADYQSAGGICRGSMLDIIAPGVFPVTNKSCELHQPDDFYYGFEAAWSTLIGREDHSDALPALLCHKEPARRIQSPLLAPRWFFMP